MEHGYALNQGCLVETLVGQSEMSLQGIANMSSPLLYVSYHTSFEDLVSSYPTASLLQVGQKAVRLQAPLHHLMEKYDLPSTPVKEPACHEILSDGQFGETSNRLIRFMAHDKPTARAPSRPNRVSNTIVTTGARDVGLIERIIVGDVVEMLKMVNTPQQESNLGEHTWATVTMPTCGSLRACGSSARRTSGSGIMSASNNEMNSLSPPGRFLTKHLIVVLMLPAL